MCSTFDKMPGNTNKKYLNNRKWFANIHHKLCDEIKKVTYRKREVEMAGG